MGFQIPLMDTVDFAVQRVCEYVNFIEHADLDIWNASCVCENEWNTFLSNYFTIVHYGGKMLKAQNDDLLVCLFYF